MQHQALMPCPMSTKCCWHAILCCVWLCTKVQGQTNKVWLCAALRELNLVQMFMYQSLKTSHCTAYRKPLAQSGHFVTFHRCVFTLASSHVCKPVVHQHVKMSSMRCTTQVQSAECESAFTPIACGQWLYIEWHNVHTMHTPCIHQNDIMYVHHEQHTILHHAAWGHVRRHRTVQLQCIYMQCICSAVVQQQLHDACCCVTCSTHQVFGICRYKRHSCEGVKGKSPGVPIGQRGVMQTHKELHNKAAPVKHKPPSRRSSHVHHYGGSQIVSKQVFHG